MGIMVAVDESEAGRRALRWASALADRLSLPLEAVRAWVYPNVPLDSLPDADALDRRTGSELKGLLADISPAGEVSSTVLRGPAGPALLEWIEHQHPDLVVVGRRGEDTPQTVLGSVSRRVVEHALAPVVVVCGDDERAGPFDSNTIVVGIDGSPHSDRALAWACDIGSVVGARVVAVHAFNVDAEPTATGVDPVEVSKLILAEAETYMDGRGMTASVASRPGDPRQVIEDAAEAEDADLIVVGTRGLGLLGKLVLGSVASYLAQHVTRPVAVVPSAEVAPGPA